MKEYNCIVLNDYPDAPYATWVYEQRKKIETRMKMFKYRGDIIICCGNKSTSKNAGKALCIVNLFDARPMNKWDEKLAMIKNAPGRVAHLLKDWRYFNRTFNFSKQRVRGAFQSIFQIYLPIDVHIVSKKDRETYKLT